MPSTYAFNGTVLVRGRFYDETGQPRDPNDIMLNVRAPNGAVSSHLYSDVDTAIERAGEGIYTAIIRANVVGRWGYQWLAVAPSETGSQPAEEGYFDVRPSAFV